MPTPISRRDMLRTTAALAGTAAFGRPQSSHAASSLRPNIIFIMADDLGYGDLGCFGQERIQTPQLDRMAQEGTRFTQCYAGSTVCAPSRCCLMTGLHSGHAYVRGNDRVPLRPEDVTVAEVLRDAGYRTALIGKWGLGEPDTTGVPNEKGFDYFFGYLNQGHAHNFYPEYLWRDKTRVPLEGNKEGDEPQVSIERTQYSHDLFAEDALAFVDRQSAAQPFFLYLAFTIPHANNERGRALGDGMEVPDYGPYADKDWPNTEKGRAAMITRMDRDVGRLLDKLKAKGLDENTLVIFTSDNGPHKEGGSDPEYFKSGGPLRGIKRDLYEGGIRVPTIARWPAHVPAGKTNDHVWAFWDVLPTAAELAGAKSPEGIDGRSQVKALLGATEQRDDFLYWEFHERGTKVAVRWHDWKAVSLPEQPLELYDLSKDIGETKNIAADHPDVIQRIKDYLKTARTESEFWPKKT